MNCILYARKSSESEDRQILSIEAQIKELKAVALNQGLNIVEVFSEAKSAKAPGRPIFNNMMKGIFQSGGMSILCWKLDRLARNPVDGGSLIWAIEQKKLARIFTPSREFKNSGDDKFWMQLEFGIAKKYVDDLSDNVKRGIRAKLDKGLIPGRPPLGYLNDKASKTVAIDPDRFHFVRRIWDVVLSGEYNIRELLKTAEENWGLSTPQIRTMGGRALTYSGLYRLLSNPFYYGVIKHKDELYPGIHRPMITKTEFDRVQKMLGRAGRSRTKREFAFTGLIRCGECGGMVTAEEKINRHGNHYTYYHCTKRKGGIHNECHQKYIRDEEIEKQVLACLEKIHVPETVVSWALDQLKRAKTDEIKFQESARASLRKKLIECQKKLDNLLQLKLKDLLTDDEFLAEKNVLIDKKISIEQENCSLDNNPKSWFEPAERFVYFLNLAKNLFRDGDDALKRQILITVGSNLLLKDKFLLIEAKNPFQLVAENGKSLLWYRQIDRVRTFFLDPANHFHIPDLARIRK